MAEAPRSEESLKPTDIGLEIASRAFWWIDGTKRCEIVVRIGKPEPFEGTTNLYCPIEITGSGLMTKYAVGVDAIQAISLAFRMVQVDLEVLEKDLGCKLRWAGGGVADF